MDADGDTLHEDPPPAQVRYYPPGVREHIDAALASRAVNALRATLARSGLTIAPTPILYKYLSGDSLRLMFPVTGGLIEEGAVVSIVCLHDVETGRTLYAHPMHAGPHVNPLLKHLDGPMAAPKAQNGADGDRATLRIIEHKRALWDRFLRERSVLGREEAGRRWREGYYWALKRLYFCARCAPCRWGSPFFDGPDPDAPREATALSVSWSTPQLSRRHAEVVAAVVSSDAWQIETNYAGRGGFSVRAWPRLVKELPEGCVQIVFPTNAALIQAGTPVALSVTYLRPARKVILAHCVCAGPEPDIPMLRGDVSLGLPPPQPGTAGKEARSAYSAWRRDAWSRFWLDELERGLAEASANWLSAFWSALARLYGGNDLDCDAEQHDRTTALRQQPQSNTSVTPRAREHAELR